MKAQDLTLAELLRAEPDEGLLRLGGRRVVLLDVVAMGSLRKELIERFGETVARGLLTRMGYADGWSTAENFGAEFPWDTVREWKIAGGRLAQIGGRMRLELIERAPGETAPFAESYWHHSFEAEQHVLNLGRSESPVCWAQAGFASGYLSYVNQREIYCIERRCAAQGHGTCHLVGFPLEEWGPEIESHLPYYRGADLDAELARVTDALKRAERDLRTRSRSFAAYSDIGASTASRAPAMQRVLELTKRVARVDSTVLITGESGVGKERIARTIHDESPRAERPFVAVNCAAITDTLLESELFGHARGSFTGAADDHAGMFEAATGGTLFLDEIGEVTPAMQVKLLRALQEREIRRVGETHTRSIDLRVIAATNRDLVRDVEAGRFRQDLYYRLRVVEVAVPPLRERREDILPLARILLETAALRLGVRVAGFTPDAADRLLAYTWPGNVRELENAIERAVALVQSVRIETEDLPPEVRGDAAPPPPVQQDIRPLAEVEREHILAALARNEGNRERAADALGIGIATLYRRLKAYRVDAEA